MAIVESDVLRIEGTETGLFYALRNRQIGFSLDSKKLIHKYADGTMQKFIPEDQMNLYGATGIQGNLGDIGYTGVQGETGLSLPGATGLQGATGLPGTGGTAGPQGATGVQGIQGNQGIQGIQGVQGIQGNAGAQGATGVQGVAGSNGTNGTDGQTGAQGETGATFVSSNMRITEEGALQIKMVNDSSSYLQPNYFVSLKTTNYPNGITTDVTNFEKTVGIVSTGGATGAECWVTTKGKCVLNFDPDYLPDAGDNFGISFGENGPAFGQKLQTHTKADGYVLSGVTGTLNAATVLYNGHNIGQLQGYVDLAVVGYAATYITAQVIKDGSFVTLKFAGFQPGTDCSGSFGIELTSFIQPANLTRTLPMSTCGTFYNAGSVMYQNAVHGEYESTFNRLYFKNFDLSTGTDIGWTGSVGWYGYITIAYSLTPGV